MRHKSLMLSALLACSLVLPAFAQDASPMRKESTKGAVIKGRAPVSQEVVRVTFPKPQELTLSNGLTVLILPDNRLPKVWMTMLMRHGSFDDPAELPGLAGVTADLLTEGAAGMPSLTIAEKLDGMGASFSASANFGSSVSSASISGLSEYTDDMLKLYADLLLRPDFPQAELESYKERELAGLTQARTQPSFLANERFRAALYPAHPAGVVAPTEASLQKITRDDLVKYHKSYYLPNDAIMAVCGDVSVEALKPKLEAAFGGWAQGKAPVAKLKKIKPAKKIQILVVDRAGSVQANLLLGNVGLLRTSPDYAAVNVMNQILGAASSSRLFMKLREEKGYTYGAYSSFTMSDYPGPWQANAEVRTEVVGPAVEEFISEFNKIRNEPVPAKELADAQRGLVARFALSLESTPALLNRALELRRFGLPADYWDRYPEQVEKITPEQVQAMAKKYILPGSMQVVAVGDAAKIKPALEKLGPVSLFGPDGMPVK